MANTVWENHFGNYATSGNCAVPNCYKIMFKNRHCNVNNHGQHGVWEVDHKNPTSKGGSEQLRNKRPICCDCNREKSDSTNRRWY